MGTIRLNRPERRNAFTFDMVREWARLLREARTDDSVRVLVLTGAGDQAFCSGIDLGSISNANPNLTPLSGSHSCTTRSTRWRWPSRRWTSR